MISKKQIIEFKDKLSKLSNDLVKIEIGQEILYQLTNQLNRPHPDDHILTLVDVSKFFEVNSERESEELYSIVRDLFKRRGSSIGVSSEYGAYSLDGSKGKLNSIFFIKINS